MNLNKHLPIFAALTALLIGSVTACNSYASETSKPDQKVLQSYKVIVETSLKKGMAAKEIEQLLGKPAEVKAMNAPNGKAEVWVYRQQIGEVIKQIQVGSKPITVMVRGTDGTDRPQVISEEPIFKMQHDITEETLSLLMFNDHFAEKKITSAVRREFI